MTKEEILKILEKEKEEVRRRYKAEIKGIFGSYAKRKEKKDSDIDILVDFEEGADFFDLMGLTLFLEEKLNHKVDIVPRRALREELKADVLRETIYL